MQNSLLLRLRDGFRTLSNIARQNSLPKTINYFKLNTIHQSSENLMKEL